MLLITREYRYIGLSGNLKSIFCEVYVSTCKIFLYFPRVCRVSNKSHTKLRIKERAACIVTFHSQKFSFILDEVESNNNSLSDFHSPRHYKIILEPHAGAHDKMISSISSSQCCTNTEVYTKNVAHRNSIDTASDTVGEVSLTRKPGLFEFETEVTWSFAVLLFALHAVGIYGILTFDYFENLKSTSWILGMHVLAIFGVSGGAHRLWSHKSYKAKLPLRILLALLYAVAGQSSIYSWVRNHRLHHKYSDTDADPHNRNRGLFFSHVGWLMMEKHPKFLEANKKLDLSDILSDPVVVFSDKYFLLLQLIFSFILPTIVPVYFWNESWGRAIISQVFIRHIRPTNNKLVNVLTFGEGLHNYHHVFSWDYRSGEINISAINYTTHFIDMFVKLGLAYDLKFPSTNLIKKVAMSRGDGSYPLNYEVPLSENI
ncbi:(11Z)-hexadec-11-enoyl-CoA conjugase-like isoform X2 [Odontomachus brunneus]|uniref:(11Z)-hexadec-11-enoyl-CoA conjugase-like isoform X2 n=1 Tax=Odontomachus brunneus TaxID=486640 RepID=UPI0013F29481|nr:(11Z)-hexadec-11-enoyl-CoA conjugase-like isoform X2 [Odontomachus brunneus]